MMFFEPELKPSRFVIRYAVGQHEREAVVLANGHSLEEHVDRVEVLMDPVTRATLTPTPFATCPCSQGARWLSGSTPSSPLKPWKFENTLRQSPAVNRPCGLVSR
ncbi:hypothetical protein [Streptomyces hundungensis]|uniref:hypothetical protein n=1 Tax=Streptomyces hundungensis TaxID=1077946 RepID=UPI003401C9DE